MDFDSPILWVLILIIAIFIVAAIIISIMYNRMITMRNKVKEAYRAIDVSLENRFDTFTNMAETVAGYTDHERDVLENVTKLRNQFAMLKGDDDNGKIKQTNAASRLLDGMNVQIEKYPELKADELYLGLQKTINQMEERLAASRRTYNARVNKYNTWIQRIPVVILAKVMNFQTWELLEAPEEKRENVDIGSILRG